MGRHCRSRSVAYRGIRRLVDTQYRFGGSCGDDRAGRYNPRRDGMKRPPMGAPD